MKLIAWWYVLAIFGGIVKAAWFDLVIAASPPKGKLVDPGVTDILHAWAYLPDLAETFVQLAAQRVQFKGAYRYHFAGHTFSGNFLLTSTSGFARCETMLQDRINWQQVFVIS